MTTRMLACSILAVLLWTAPASRGATSAPIDVAVGETPAGLQIFVADPSRGRLFSGTVRGRAQLVPVRDLESVSPCGPIDRVAAVAVRGARLVVVTGDGMPAAIECSLDTREQRILHVGEPFREPASVAIAADGSVAVVDRVLRAVVVVGRDKEPRVVRPSPSPMMIRADDAGQLYVLDSEARSVIPIQLAEPGGRSFSSASAGQQARPASPFLALSVEPAAFAVMRDVFYVAETTGPVRTQLAGGRLSLEIPDVRPRPAGVSASRNYLAMIDRDASMVEIIDRPLPMGVVLDPVKGNPNEGWLALLEYMAERRLLPRDRVKVLPEDSSYEAVLRRNGVLVTVDERPEAVAVSPGRTAALFCSLNPTVCNDGFSVRLPTVVIPEAAPRPELQTDTTLLGGRDVKSLIDERVLLAEHRKVVTDGYLATRNASVAASLETEMLRRKMVLATPMNGQLIAGTIVRIVDGREEVQGHISARCEGLTASTSKTSLISPLSAPRATLPIVGFAPAATRVNLSVGSWLRSTISLAALEQCRPLAAGPDTYIVAESLAVADVTFEPLGSSQTGKAPGASSSVSGPFYVGYRAIPISGLMAGVTVPAEPDRLKPVPAAGSSGIWTLSIGSLALPVTRWRADILVPAADVYAVDGALRRLQTEKPAIDLSARERLDRTTFSSHVVNVMLDGDVPESIESTRTALIKAIKYDEQLAAGAGTEDVYIGVVERRDSVNLDHPGFLLDGQSAWYEFVPASGMLEPRQPQVAAPAPLSLRRVDPATEHGTHVAGTIAARRPPALTLGMLPKTRLVLVPSDSMADLKNSIQTARDHFVYLFNLSLGFTAATSNETLEDLHGRIQQSWKDALFVVAAGNDGADLNVVGASAPVFWASTLPNVMVVGASDDRGENVLGQHQDSTDPEEQKGSNSGSRYVDLLAPGQVVHSLGRDSYAYACGSSHAAPQVTATAAMLWTRLKNPEVIRARLIYTADWKEPNFNKRVWGGLLNVKRAVFAPNNNVITKAGLDATPHEIKPAANATVNIEGDIQERDGRITAFRDEKFPFNRVLRIEPLGAGRSRIVLLSRPNGVLTIVKGTIQGAIKCEAVKKANDQGQFVLPPDVPINCGQGFPIGQIKDYVAATPAAVRFQ